jgi:hypothetical protein
MKSFDEAKKEIMRSMNIEAEGLALDFLKGLLASGDLMQHLCRDAPMVEGTITQKLGYSYIPYRELGKANREITDLRGIIIGALASDTPHDYIYQELEKMEGEE